MKLQDISSQVKKEFNNLASHPLQSWEWGDFREKMGVKIIRLGIFKGNKLVETSQISIHDIPHTKYKIGYLPKGQVPSKKMLEEIYDIGQKNGCIFIKLEPNIINESSGFSVLGSKFNIVVSSHPLFTKYTFLLDLTKSEEELLKEMKEKTRYNTRLAERKGVRIIKSNDFETYWKLMDETTKRQQFFAHAKKYHQTMWETLNKTGIAHLFLAKFGDMTLTAWIVFLFNNVLYYPYGASSQEKRELMASNLMMWEVIKWGKINDAKTFDMWGAMGPNPDKTDPWYGFHRFKEGYNPSLVEFAGSYDLVINPTLYRLYNLSYKIRQLLLSFKSRFQ